MSTGTRDAPREPRGPLGEMTAPTHAPRLGSGAAPTDRHSREPYRMGRGAGHLSERRAAFLAQLRVILQGVYWR